MIYACIYIYIYIYIHSFSSCLLQYCNINYFASQCVFFSHALHDKFFNLPYRSFLLFDL